MWCCPAMTRYLRLAAVAALLLLSTWCLFRFSTSPPVDAPPLFSERNCLANENLKQQLLNSYSFVEAATAASLPKKDIGDAHSQDHPSDRDHARAVLWLKSIRGDALDQCLHNMSSSRVEREGVEMLFSAEQKRRHYLESVTVAMEESLDSHRKAIVDLSRKRDTALRALELVPKEKRSSARCRAEVEELREELTRAMNEAHGRREERKKAAPNGVHWSPMTAVLTIWTHQGSGLEYFIQWLVTRCLATVIEYTYPRQADKGTVRHRRNVHCSPPAKCSLFASHGDLPSVAHPRCAIARRSHP